MNRTTNNTTLLQEKVYSKIGTPVSNLVVMATIESLGVREEDVISDYGFTDIAGLSDYIYTSLKGTTSSLQKGKAVTSTFTVSNYLKVKVELFSKYYTLGIFHLLPVFIQIVAIIWFGYSLWTSVGFNQLQSTAVVMGVIIGMILSGGFVQVIGNQLSFYHNYKQYANSLALIKYSIKQYLKFMSVISLAFILINYLIPLIPFPVVFISLCYANCIGLVLVFLAILHPIKQRWVISVAVLVGTSFSVGSIYYTNLHVYWSHWIGMLLVVACVLGYLVLYFKKHLQESNHISSLKISNIVYKNYTHFIYGFFFYLFFFTDRILAWSVERASNMPLLFFYEKDYEIGMDIAIVVFLLLAGVLEFSVATFSKFLQVEQLNTSATNIKHFSYKMFKIYKQNVVVLLSSSLVIFAMVYWIVSSTWGYQYQFNEMLNQLSIKVCVIACIAYFFLAWSVLNCLYLMSLHQLKLIISILISSFVANAVVGFFCSRLISYEYSVIGLLVGTILFFVLSMNEVYKFYKKLDYYYYAAY